MRTLKLCCELKSAATFGRGDGVAGFVDLEVEHDANGLPYVGGRALKGLLAEECANILYSLDVIGIAGEWRDAAYALFGRPGSTTLATGLLRVGEARVPAALQAAVEQALVAPGSRWTPERVLDSLTGVRRQTSMTRQGAPEEGSLRAMRVILPGLILESELLYKGSEDRHLALLAACVAAWRRGGAARNRGRGRLVAWLEEDGRDVTREWFARFSQEVGA